MYAAIKGFEIQKNELRNFMAEIESVGRLEYIIAILSLKAV